MSDWVRVDIGHGPLNDWQYARVLRRDVVNNVFGIPIQQAQVLLADGRIVTIDMWEEVTS